MIYGQKQRSKLLRARLHIDRCPARNETVNRAECGLTEHIQREGVRRAVYRVRIRQEPGKLRTNDSFCNPIHRILT